MKQQRRQLRFDDWDAVLADVESLRAGGYARAGNLNLGQICNHLAIIMEMAVDGFPKSMPWIMQRFLRLMFLKTMLRHKPISLRVPAPAIARQDEPVEDDRGVPRLKAAIARFAAPNITYASHMAFGALTPDEWMHQQLWHCEHHLSFLSPATLD